MRISQSLPTPLFRSERQAAILSALFFSTEKVSIFDLSERLEIPYPSIHREISRLIKAGIVEQRKVGNTSLLSANQHSPYYKPLFELLQITSGPVPLLRSALREITGVGLAYLFGSWAQRIIGRDGPIPNDVDVLVIGNPDVQAVNKACKRVGKSIGWEVNAVIMSQVEWMQETPFLRQVKSDGVVLIFDSIGEEQ